MIGKNYELLSKKTLNKNETLTRIGYEFHIAT